MLTNDANTDPSKHTRCGSNVGLMLTHRLRRWVNINPTLDPCLVLTRIILLPRFFTLGALHRLVVPRLLATRSWWGLLIAILEPYITARAGFTLSLTAFTEEKV